MVENTTNNTNKKIFYISDFSLPNMSAYTLHVLKMCDAFSETGHSVKLLIPYISKDYLLERIKEDYLLKSFFKIKGFFKSKIKRNFLTLLIFSFKLFKYFKINQNPHLIISRSIIPALLLSIFGEKILLEIHTEPRGLTKIIFLILKNLNFNKNLKFILIHKNLNKKLKLKDKSFIILDDCVDLRDFKHRDEKINSCVYTGSFVKGKGVDTIINVASKLPKINFFLYGNIKTLDENLYKDVLKKKNIILNDFVAYKEITKILPENKILLMPYEKEVGVLIDNLDVSDYISPLKLFDYLASGSVIIASNKDAYSHILKDRYNCFLADSSDPTKWVNIINTALSNTDMVNKIQKNSIESAKNYSWLNRVKKIFQFFNSY